MEVSESIVLGVASGVITSIIVLLVSVFMRKVLIPWYRQIIYHGIDVDGEWTTKTVYPSGNAQEMLMTIEQKADKVVGLVNVVNSNKGVDDLEMKVYRISGKIRDRFLLIQGYNSDKKSLGFQSELLEIVGDGKKMKGCVAWYNVSSEEVHSMDVTWKRK